MTLEQIMKDMERRVDLYREESRKKRCPELFYRSRGLYEALAMLTASLDGKPEVLTLKELAHELRKIFKFKYLTVSPYREEVLLWWDKPESDGFYWWATETCTQVAFYSDVLSVPINLSEYRDADGNIDYSRCIVEVTDDIN